MNPPTIAFVVLSAFLAEMVASKPQKLMSKQGWTCGQKHLSHNFKIVGGQTVPIESQPWMATIFFSIGNQFFCGGSLIHPCWVLTAAHCFSGVRADKSKLIIRLGRSATNAPNANDQEFRAEKLIIHKSFTQPNNDYTNDVALIKIRSRAGKCAKESNIVKTICLPSKNLMLKDGSSCEVAGYGKQNKSSTSYSEVLKSADVQLVSLPACQSSYEGHSVTDNIVCASHWEWKTDSCTGDSGGPLSCMSDGRMVLYGIISWGDGCAKKGKPGVYTRVTKQIAWIESNMKLGNKPKRPLANS